MRTAPANSKTEAIKIACLRVTDLLPTAGKTIGAVVTPPPQALETKQNSRNKDPSIHLSAKIDNFLKILKLKIDFREYHG